jgi:hypothetical protein
MYLHPKSRVSARFDRPQTSIVSRCLKTRDRLPVSNGDTSSIIVASFESRHRVVVVELTR